MTFIIILIIGFILAIVGISIISGSGTESRADLYETHPELLDLKKKQDEEWQQQQFQHKNQQQTSQNPYEEPLADYLPVETQRYIEFTNNPIIREHYDNILVAKELYTQMTKNNIFFGHDAELAIRILERDIDICDNFISVHLAYNREIPPMYFSFLTLAKIYEHRKEYEKALEVCIRAIQCGYSNDGTKGGMAARYDRLMDKLEKNSPKF